MAGIRAQIGELETLMNAKGYDGHFLCNSAHPGRLKESLYGHLGTSQREQTVAPFYLTTYSHWKDEDRPYVRCEFNIEYDPSKGFRVNGMEVTRANRFGIMKSIELRPSKNDEIPACEEANALVGQKKRTLKLN
jgi:hypothetical protein